MPVEAAMPIDDLDQCGYCFAEHRKVGGFATAALKRVAG